MFAGDHYYGKVDHVPGLFFVATRFLHYLWIPLLPRESYLIRDDGSRLGIRIPLRWKSVWLTWARTWLGFVAISFVSGGVALLRMDPQGGKLHPGIIAAFFWGVALLMATLYLFTHRFSRAGLNRAVELGQLLNFAPDEIEQRFSWPEIAGQAPEPREIATEIADGLRDASASVADAIGETSSRLTYVTVLLVLTLGISGLGLVVGIAVLYLVTHLAGASAVVVYGTTLLVAVAIPTLCVRNWQFILQRPAYLGESRRFWIILCSSAWVVGTVLSLWSLL